MKKMKDSEKVLQKFLKVLPSWNAKMIRPFKEQIKKQMTLETYCCLETLRREGMMTMGELSQELKVPKQNMTKLVESLVEHAFVERVYKEKDRRVIWIKITDIALQYLDDYYRKNPDFCAMLETHLNETELKEMAEALNTLEHLLPKLK